MDVEDLHQAVVDENRLNHHGGATEQFHIAPQNGVEDPQQNPLVQRIAVGVDGDGLQGAHCKADQAAHQGAHQGQQQGSACAPQIGKPVFLQQEGTLVQKFVHTGNSFVLPARGPKTTTAPTGQKVRPGLDGCVWLGDYSLRGWTEMASSIMVL